MFNNLLKNIGIVKQSFYDAFHNDTGNSPVNNYYYEKGRKGFKFSIPKSDYFEMKCFEDLSKVYGCGLKKILTDLLIPNAVGQTTQLDLVFINRSGIYVIESKDYNCTVEYKNKKTWIRRDFGGKVTEFQSPIEQNEHHVDNLKKLLHDYDDNYYKSIVVFSNKCIIRHYAGHEKYDTRVLNHKNLKATVREMIKSNPTILTEDEIYEIYNRLSQYARVDAVKKNKHIDYVNMIKH